MSKEGEQSKPPRTLPAKHRSERTQKYINRTQARRIAERHVPDRMFKGGTVLDGKEAKLGMLDRSELLVKDIWVVYQLPEGPLRFCNSEIVVICKHTGNVLYEGSAFDEG